MELHSKYHDKEKKKINMTRNAGMCFKIYIGYTVGNDVSARKWQTQLCGGQWCFGKGFDTFNPLGPMIVSSKVIQDPNNLRLGTKVNGKVLQDWNTNDMSMCYGLFFSAL